MCCWCFRNTPIGAFSVPIDHVRAVIMVMTMSGCWWLTGWQWLWKTKIMEIFPMSVIRVLLSQWIICTKKHLQSNVHQHPRSIPLIDNWHSIYRYSIDTLADTPSSHDQHLGRKLTNVAGMAVSVNQYFWVGWHYSQYWVLIEMLSVNWVSAKYWSRQVVATLRVLIQGIEWHSTTDSFNTHKECSDFWKNVKLQP